MKRYPRRKPAYQGYQGRRRKTGSPFPLILALILLAGAGIFLYRYFQTPEEKVPDPPPAAAAPEEPQGLTEHMTTPPAFPVRGRTWGRRPCIPGI